MAMSNRDRALARSESWSGSATSRLIPTVVPLSACGLRLDAPGVSSATQNRAPSMAISDDPAVLVGVAVDLFVSECPLVEGDCLLLVIMK
jgi:hypothetical protein